MKVKPLFSLFFLLFSIVSFSQNNALVLNGAYMVMNGGTPATPIYLVVNQTYTTGITRTGGHIISEGDYNFVKWNMGSTDGSYEYPFGYSTTDYIPFTFNKTAGNANLAVSTYYPTTNANANLPLADGVLNMKPSGSVSDSSDMVVDRWWRIQVENGSVNPQGDLTFSYRGSENTIAGISCGSDVLVAQYWNGGPLWETPALNPGSACTLSGIGTAQANSVSVFTTTSSQPFVLVNKKNILPVELLTFSTQCDKRRIIVKWSTASENNNDYFTVERSPDGLNYLPVGLVNGAGNSSAIHHYSFTDTDPLNGTSYYRLRQTDFNGMTELFSSTSISSCGRGGLSVTIGQNPAINGNVWVSISGAENKNVSVAVTDILGQNLYSKNLTGLTGSYLLNAELQLSGGIYVVSAFTGDEIFSKKIVVVR